jgi:hypothetical protein
VPSERSHRPRRLSPRLPPTRSQRFKGPALTVVASSRAGPRRRLTPSVRPTMCHVGASPRGSGRSIGTPPSQSPRVGGPRPGRKSTASEHSVDQAAYDRAASRVLEADSGSCNVNTEGREDRRCPARSGQGRPTRQLMALECRRRPERQADDHQVVAVPVSDGLPERSRNSSRTSATKTLARPAPIANCLRNVSAEMGFRYCSRCCRSASRARSRSCSSSPCRPGQRAGS